MIYQVDWIEIKKAQSGKNYAVATLSRDNKVIEDVKIFQGFEGLRAGQSTPDGIMKQNEYKGKIGYIFEIDVSKPSTYVPKPNQIKVAQEAKGKMIVESQERKQEAIKISQTMRDAVLIALAELGNNKDHTEYESRIVYWRKWLWKEWDTEQEPF